MRYIKFTCDWCKKIFESEDRNGRDAVPQPMTSVFWGDICESCLFEALGDLQEKREKTREKL